MKLLTLTPDAQAFAVAVIACYSLASASLAGYVQLSWPRRSATPPPPFLPLYVGITAAVTGAALATLSLPIVTGGSPGALALAVPIGIGIGLAGLRLDAIARRVGRRRAREARPRMRPRATARAPRSGGQPVAAVPGEGSASVSTLALLVAVGALEELLFRGVLVDLSRSIRSPGLEAACLVATVAVFALSHVYWGWSEVASKAALGVLALAAVLGLGTVLPAVLAHGTFNAGTWIAARAATGADRRTESAPGSVRAARSSAESR